MTTEKHLWSTSQETTDHSVRARLTVCGCGQDLDIVTGQHCPRCGTILQTAA